jgi:hypothetical protein
MRRLFVILLAFAVFILYASAQEKTGFSSELLDAIFTQIAENSEQEEIDQTALYEDLLYFSQNPINLNNTNKEQLERLQFLSDIQIENLLYYLYQHGPMLSIYELQLVEGFYMQDIQILLPFVIVGERIKRKEQLKLANVFKYGRQEILFRVDRGVETKEGYQFLPEEELLQNPNKQYLGDPFYTSLKYQFRYRDKIQFGLTAEKDAGEQFWGDKNKGYDFYSGYLQLNDFGRFKTIVVGDYRANFGQGLVMRNEYSFGKSSLVLNVTPRNSGLKKSSSTDEYNFLRGAGTTVSLGKFDITAFYSYRKLDADTAEGQFTSIKKDGLHRTESDLYKKQNVTQQVVGGNITFSHANFKVGVTLMNTWFDHTLQPTVRPYNRYYFSGNRQAAASIDYRLRWNRFNFFGETAIKDNGGIATLNGVLMNPFSSVGLVILHRYFSPQYDVLFANAFSETSRINNEEGLYIGAEVRPMKFWKISAYADSYRFPWLNYGVDKPSKGYDLLLQADYAPNRNTEMYWRFRFEQKEDNTSGNTNTTPLVEIFDKSSLRYNLSYRISPELRLKNMIEVNYAKNGSQEATYGFIASQDISYSFAKIPLSIDLRYEVFDAPDYDNRFYTYEKDILYAFSIPMFYGRGSRYYLNLRYELNKNLAFWFKIGQTSYLDKSAIGSGLEEIEGNTKTDVRFLLRWKF